jgi:hypothetical protein
MANADTPRGLWPRKYLGGAAWDGRASLYYIPASDTDAAVYLGGLVKRAGSADANGVMSVTGNVATSNLILGVVVSFDPGMGAGAAQNASTLYRANSTERYCYVVDDPMVLFSVQDDATATLTAGDVGSTADLAGFTSGSTVTGLSAIEISATTAGGTTGDHDVLIMGLDRYPGNAIGDHADWLVRLINHSNTGDVIGVD